MGRPRKKRKYTRRIDLQFPAGPGRENGAARDLLLKVRGQLMTAPLDVRKVVIPDLINDLQWMAQVDEENAPAP